MQDHEFKSALTIEEIERFSADKFLRWVYWRTGLHSATYSDLDISSFATAEDLLRAPNIPQTIKKCFEDYRPISKVITAICNKTHIRWPHLAYESEEFQTFCKKHFKLERPSTKVLSWFIGAVQFFDITDPVVYSVANNQTITRPLPGISEKEINLTLLKGDLGDENADSNIVSKIVHLLDGTYPSLHYLVGVSGAGKTKALFDIGRKFVSIYLDFKKGELESAFKKKIKEVSDTTTGFQQMRIFEYEIGVLLATRLVLLMIMKLKNPNVTNEQMLLAQTNGYSDRYKDWYSAIETILREDFTTNIAIDTVFDAARFFLGVEKSTLFILCDKSQELLGTGSDDFYPKLITEIVHYGNGIIAGTSLDLIRFDNVRGEIAKPRGEGITYDQHINFKYITTAVDCRQIVERLFDVTLSDDHVQHILDKLQGRPRFIINLAYVAQLDQYKKVNNPSKSNEEILMKIVEDLFHHLTTLNGHSLERAINHKNTPAVVINTEFDRECRLAELLRSYYEKKGISIQNGTCYFDKGLVGVICRIDEDLCYQVTEPLIAEAVLKAFKRKGMKVPTHYLSGTENGSAKRPREEDVENQLATKKFKSRDQ